MAKKINADEIDERLIVASVGRNRTAARESDAAESVSPTRPERTEPPELPEPAEEIPVAPEPAKPEPAKEDARDKRAAHSEYESRFLRETDLPPARFGKSVYIRKEYHDRISQIISVVGGNEISLFGYVDNVLAHHFECFRDDMVRSFRKKTIFK